MTIAAIATRTTDVQRSVPRPVRVHLLRVAVGPRHRGRLFHVHHKPLYAAICQTDNRHRKPMSTGRMIERLVLLDAVLDDATCTWLATEFDKRLYFIRALGRTSR
jgi:hypothetical protein